MKPKSLENRKPRSVPRTKLSPLEFRVWRKLESVPELRGSRVLIACSGGVDSITLLEIMATLAKRLSLEIEVAHVHHGSGENRAVTLARNRALACVRAESGKRGLVFHAHRRALTSSPLVSEASLRKLRHAALEKIARKRDCRFIVFAHHADDLFETRLIRLIRGTGAQGLEAMRLVKGAVLRPLLEEKRIELRALAIERKLKWSEDPTNADPSALRNWLRKEWLPALEAKRPGSSAAFLRSLDQITAALTLELGARGEGGHAKSVPAAALRARQESRVETEAESFSREEFLKLENAERSSAIAACLLRLNTVDFTSSHVSEIIKRLQSRRTRSFEMLNLSFSVNAGQILVARSRNAT